MIVNALELSNFRNYKELNIDFSKDINILYGDNAQGKTNVLEAVYLSSTTKSHKGAKDKDMIKIGEEECHLRMYFKKADINHRIDMHLRKNGKKSAAVDGIPVRKSSDVYGLMNVVFFSPEDLSIIKNGPGERRKFMDAELCQLDKLYLQYLSKYNKTLEQRNDLLKQISFRPDLRETIEVWDMQLAEYGRFIIEQRDKFVNDLNNLVKDIHYRISDEKENLNLKYEPSVRAEDFEDTLRKTLDRDIYQKTTCCGPHRDEISFYAGKKSDENEKTEGENLKLFGSQGQQRTAALSLKLAEIELVKEKIGENPILLLDDVLSELDRNRQQALLNSINGIQTIITCTGLEEFVGYRSSMNTLYKVTNGTIEKI